MPGLGPGIHEHPYYLRRSLLQTTSWMARPSLAVTWRGRKGLTRDPIVGRQCQEIREGFGENQIGEQRTGFRELAPVIGCSAHRRLLLGKRLRDHLFAQFAIDGAAVAEL